MQNLLVLFMMVILTFMVQAGPLAMGICFTGCNALWVTCVAAGGGVAGVSTGGLGVPAAILACNVGQGFCMSSCAIALALPTP